MSGGFNFIDCVCVHRDTVPLFQFTVPNPARVSRTQVMDLSKLTEEFVPLEHMTDTWNICAESFSAYFLIGKMLLQWKHFGVQ